MGYRLELHRVIPAESGGKLYGYVSQEYLESLESWKWLKEKMYIEGDEEWDYGCENMVELPPYEFKTFIELYIKDYNKYYGEERLTMDHFKESLESGDWILLQWY